ncbi:hypothetical protein PEP31012_00328 [Pandoraea eparura]|uniref:DUF962 domain-containing protein n=1 Tax=Pandoraea eparura TaxID=2508291 RepID=A0A5E4RQD0_9BURK|nr:Mpo1-like protein [Pandoraea eparura]VVD65547.1 hypothetical protein PEP31012_00328 [Pandoraea eparura]
MSDSVEKGGQFMLGRLFCQWQAMPFVKRPWLPSQIVAAQQIVVPAMTTMECRAQLAVGAVADAVGGKPAFPPSPRQEARMKSLAQQMSFYQRYHRSAKNRLTHFFGVPMIILAVMQALSWLPLGPSGLNVAHVTVLVLLTYYFLLDVPLALAMTAFFAVLLAITQHLATLSWPWALGVFGVLFVGGWIIQLIGHHFEGRKPALLDNLFQLFIAPMFLMAEVFFHFGYKPGLQRRVQELAAQSA